MLTGLDIPPLVMVLLLLYGLLIALVFTIWTALGTGRRNRQAAVRPAPEPAVEPKVEKQPVKAADPAPRTEPVRPWLRDPAAGPRPADSEAVASYSVRAATRPAPRPVTEEKPTPAPVTPPARAAERPAASPAEPAARPPAEGTDVPRVPQDQNSERARSEDAFERFLRSSGSGRDDF